MSTDWKKPLRALAEKMRAERVAGVATINAWADILEAVIDAAPDTPLPAAAPAPAKSPSEYEMEARERAREIVAKQRGKAEREEKSSRVVMIVDGPLAGTMASVAGGMPVGAFTEVAGETYQLFADGQLRRVMPVAGSPKSTIIEG